MRCLRCSGDKSSSRVESPSAAIERGEHQIAHTEIKATQKDTLMPWLTFQLTDAAVDDRKRRSSQISRRANRIRSCDWLGSDSKMLPKNTKILFGGAHYHIWQDLVG